MTTTIAIVSRGWWGSVFGGAEKFVYRLGEELYKMGYDVIGITRAIPGGREPRAPFKLIVSRPQRIIPLASSLSFSKWAGSQVNRINPDVAVVNAYWGELAPLFIERGISVITIIHDIGFIHRGGRTSILKDKARLLVLRAAALKSSIVVVPSSGVWRDVIDALRLEPGRVRVIGFEGIDGPFRYIHVDNNRFDIVQVSRFSPNKGHMVLLEAVRIAARSIDNLSLWLVGGRGVKLRDRAYLEEVMSLSKAINNEMGRRIVNVVVDPQDVSEYYMIADLCVLPSVAEEGFGLSIFECLSYGKPVIVSDLLLSLDVAPREYFYVARTGDPVDLAEKIIHVYNRIDEARQRALRSLEHIKAWNWRSVAEVFRDIFDSIAK